VIRGYVCWALGVGSRVKDWGIAFRVQGMGRRV
jgi:hypothetical protein